MVIPLVQDDRASFLKKRKTVKEEAKSADKCDSQDSPVRTLEQQAEHALLQGR